MFDSLNNSEPKEDDLPERETLQEIESPWHFFDTDPLSLHTEPDHEDRPIDPEKEPPEHRLDVKKELFDWAEALVLALSVIVIMFALFVRLIGVDGSSMVPTLADGDQLLVSHMFYDEPRQGDIVVLRKQSFMKEPIVKRVIAVEGQEIDIDPESHMVTVDGAVIYEPYINEQTLVLGDMDYPVRVPDGCVFVMGDNRNRSSDSRDRRLGIVDKRYILGRALFRIYPFSRAGLIERGLEAYYG